MKKKTLICATFLLVFVGMQVSCKERSEAEEIPFTEYSLAETSCYWTNIDIDYEYTSFNREEVLIINSNETLKNYVNCTIDNYPEINFDKYSLIAAWGIANNGISNIGKQVMQTGNGLYVFNVVIELNQAEVMTEWQVAVLVDKLPDNAKIALSAKIISPY